MDSSITATRKASLSLMVMGGLFCGLVLGLVLSESVDPAPYVHTPTKRSAPLYLNTAKKTNHKQANPSTTLASNDSPVAAPAKTAKTSVIDAAAFYLTATKAFQHNSIIFIGPLNNIQFKRPKWSWSRDDLVVEHAPINRIFGAPKHASTQNVAVPILGYKKRLVVALDPGHGGTDPGSEAHNGLIEKELTLDMAKRVELFLSEIENVDVIMTRSTDTGMSRQDRVNKIKAAGADVVVSLHFNHLPQTDVNLVETFYADRHNIIESLEAQNRSPSSVDLDYTKSSKHLAHIMHKKVYNEVATANNDVIDAGVKRETLFVLTRSFTPGVLLELTCISNPAEAERLATDSYRDQLAASIADGLRDYLRQEHSALFGELLAKVDL